MLLHLRPRILSPFRDVALVDVKIEPFGLRLRGGTDLAVRRPYPNKRYAVACRKKGHKAIDGILVETPSFVSEFTYTARWAVEAALSVTHEVAYKILDRDFDAASEDMTLWYACCEELGGWSDRFPLGARSAPPIALEPTMEVWAAHVDRRRQATDTIVAGMVVARKEILPMPTIEPERILNTRLSERIPRLTEAFHL
jgi:Family of unknown function (DUF6012)